MRRLDRIACIALLLALNMYPAVELSRVCFMWKDWHAEDSGLMLFEVAFIWLMYLANIPLVLLIYRIAASWHSFRLLRVNRKARSDREPVRSARTTEGI